MNPPCKQCDRKLTDSETTEFNEAVEIFAKYEIDYVPSVLCSECFDLMVGKAEVH